MAEAAAASGEADDDPFALLADTFAIGAESRTAAVVGGESQTALATLVVAPLAKAREPKMIPVPMTARPIIRHSAAGFRSSALTDATSLQSTALALKLVVCLRHSTHDSCIGSRALAIYTKG
jgi:hypothetical protein